MRLGVALLAAAVVLAGQDLPRGKIVDHVICSGNERQSYALYLPSDYSSAQKWPILYCLDPGARGRAPLERFAAAAERARFILAGSNNSRNGPVEPVQEAITAMMSDTHARFSIDDRHTYVAGFSGGARVALSWAMNGGVAGVVACSAGFWPPNDVPRHIPFRLFATAGVDDFNYHEMYALSRELARRGVEHRFVQLEGGHDWLTPQAANEAFEYFAGRVPSQAATESSDESKEAARFERMLAAFSEAHPEGRKRMAALWRNDAARITDDPKRRLARQALGRTYVAGMMSARESMDRKRYADAAVAWETCALVHPNDPQLWYALAVARAAEGNRRSALKALERAIDTGFRDAATMERETLLKDIRADSKFRDLLARIRH